MAGPILYSTNPWVSHDIAVRYLNGVHFAWVSDYFDNHAAPAGSAGGAVAPSSNPCEIYRRLAEDVAKEDAHSALINNYRKTFRRLAASWFADNVITAPQRDEILALMKSSSWQMWRPVLYVISRSAILPASRIIVVPRKQRAGYGPELQIPDLRPPEFDVIELKR